MAPELVKVFTWTGGYKMNKALLLSAALLLCFAVCSGCKKEDDDFIPGLSWQMSSANPVLNPSDEPTTGLCGWYNRAIWYPSVIKDGTTFKMWFTGTNTDDEDRIGYATSANGESWTIQQTPVFEPSPTPGSWDSGGVWHHCVIKDGTDYKMFYTAYETSAGTDDRIGLAHSTDGLVWTREAANPVVGTGPGGGYPLLFRQRFLHARDRTFHTPFRNGYGKRTSGRVGPGVEDVGCDADRDEKHPSSGDDGPGESIRKQRLESRPEGGCECRHAQFYSGSIPPLQ